MTVYDSTTLAALASGAHARRPMVTIRGKDSGGSPKTFGFWAGLGNITRTVTSAIDGSSESRSYIGDGALVSIDSVIYSLGLEVRDIQCVLSQVHASVQDMLRGNDIRHAQVELHVGVLDSATGAFVANPLPYWLGYVDGAPLETPADGNEGSLTLKMVSAAVDLTRTNTAKKSDAQQQLRSGDRFRRFSDTAGKFLIWWGTIKAGAQPTPAVRSPSQKSLF